MPDEIISIGDLTPDPANARKHNPRNVGTIVDALHEVGAARSIVIDENGRVLAGNATIEGAAEAGIERVQVVDADGETLIAVRRSGLTEEQKRRLAIFDNRSSELASWDTTALAHLMSENDQILNGLFTEIEVKSLFKQTPPEGVDPHDLWQGMPEFEQEDTFGAIQSITVHFERREDVEDFSRRLNQTITPNTKSIWHPHKEPERLKDYQYEQAENEP